MGQENFPLSAKIVCFISKVLRRKKCSMNRIIINNENMSKEKKSNFQLLVCHGENKLHSMR